MFRISLKAHRVENLHISLFLCVGKGIFLQHLFSTFLYAVIMFFPSFFSEGENIVFSTHARFTPNLFLFFLLFCTILSLGLRKGVFYFENWS